MQIINEKTADGEYTHFTYWHTELLNMHVWYSGHDGVYDAADTFSEQTYNIAYFQTIPFLNPQLRLICRNRIWDAKKKKVLTPKHTGFIHVHRAAKYETSH